MKPGTVIFDPLGQRIIQDSLDWLRDCMFAMQVMANDAPNQADKDMMRKVIAALEGRQRMLLTHLPKH